MKNVEKICNEITQWLKDVVEDAGCKGLVLGLSGGIDSSVVAVLSKRVFPNNTLGIIMPCYSNKQDEQHAKLLADTFDIEAKKINLNNIYDSFINKLNDDGSNKLAIANIKPRLRMITLYYHAQKNKYLVAGTGNRSELTIGYYTKHGDGGVDILPIAGLVKHEVRELARYLKIPNCIIDKAPSAGLWEKQTDENEMGFSYKQLDDYIKTGQVEDSIKFKIEKMNNESEHKRRMPLVFDIEE